VGQSAASQRSDPGWLAACRSHTESLALLLDTTVLVDALRGREAAARVRGLRSSEEAPWICAVNIDEVLRGIREHERDAAMHLLSGLHIAPLGRAEGTRAGDWRREFARKGIALSQADCLIAAAAVGIGALLATGNPKDFPMPELRVEHWPVGT
jgi:predicted nucleic acid-binding protein